MVLHVLLQKLFFGQTAYITISNIVAFVKLTFARKQVVTEESESTGIINTIEEGRIL